MAPQLYVKLNAPPGLFFSRSRTKLLPPHTENYKSFVSNLHIKLSVMREFFFASVGSKIRRGIENVNNK